MYSYIDMGYNILFIQIRVFDVSNEKEKDDLLNHLIDVISNLDDCYKSFYFDIDTDKLNAIHCSEHDTEIRRQLHNIAKGLAP